MIKAEELRIGNLAQDKSGTVWRIEYFIGIADARVDQGMLDFPTDDAHDAALIDLYPVQLTEDWLQKFSGYKRNDGIYSWEWYPEDAGGANRVFQIDPESMEYRVGSSYNDFVTAIKYVHELQNLYFALTGTELLTSS